MKNSKNHASTEFLISIAKVCLQDIEMETRKIASCTSEALCIRVPVRLADSGISKGGGK